MSPTTDFSVRLSIIHVSDLLGRGILVKLGAVYTNAAAGSRWPAQGIIGTNRDRTFKATGADINGSLIGRIPVTSNWRVLWKRQVGLGLVDLLRLVGILVDDRLECEVLARANSGVFSNDEFSPSFGKHRSRRGSFHRAVGRCETLPCASPGEWCGRSAQTFWKYGTGFFVMRNGKKNFDNFEVPDV